MRACASVLTLCVLALASVGSAGEAKQAPKREKAPRFTLMDSDGEAFAFTFPREKPVLLSFADQGGHEQMDAWLKPLLKRYGERLEHKAVAWLEFVPAAMRTVVLKVVQQSYDWVLLDWNGEVAKRYRCKANAANVFLISKDGRILFENHGPATKKRLKEAYKILDEELKKRE